MTTISLPSTQYRIRAASAGYEFAQSVATCPYTLQSTVQDFGGRRRRVTVQVPPLTKAQAEEWSEFFEDLRGMTNTFNLDLRTMFPHDGLASSVPFRLASPSIVWDITVAKHFGFSFEAVEAI